MDQSTFHIRTLAIIGVGLIGGSLAGALKQAGKVDRVIGVGRVQKNLQTALELGAIDAIQASPARAVEEADITVLATPVNTIADLFKSIAPAVTDSKVITDVGSVKGGIVHAARQSLGRRFNRFVPGHPVAGKEKSGIGAATADLFACHKVILTPTPETDCNACAAITTMWEATGAQVKRMNVDDHDRVLSVTSHLPHVLAYVMMDFLSTSPDRQSCYEMAAGGFYDFTRTASSDPEMWRDISLMNGPGLLGHIAEFQQRLADVAGMIASEDEKAIEDLYASAKQARSLVTEKRKL